MNLELSTAELRLLTQSLQHCLATCKHVREQGKDHPCEDCDAGRALLAKIQSALQSSEKH